MSGIYWLASYPKSGNTWFRAFMRNLLANSDHPVSINELNTGSIASSRGWIDEVLGFDSAELTHHEIDQLRPQIYDWSLQTDEIGHHKIHDAYTYTQDNRPLFGGAAILGALYLLRNPLDVAPSYANHNHSSIDATIKNMGDRNHGLATSRKKLNYQIRQKLPTWSEHVLSWVDNPDITVEIIRYEDMLARPEETFTRAARFLQLPDDPEQIARAIRFSDFKELSSQEKKNTFKEKPPKTDFFFRQGKSGDWRDKLTAPQIEQIIADHGEVMQRFGYLDASGRLI